MIKSKGGESLGSILEKKPQALEETRGVTLKSITKTYGEKVVYKNFSLCLQNNTITTILGGSGVGKSTLLRMIAGLESCTSGTIEVLSGRRGMLFQEPTLLPWFTVEKNIRIPLERSMTKLEIDSHVSRIITAVELEDAQELYPHELSGGMKQRVSMARAFAYPSELLLLDEPFQALDLRLRATLGELFLRLWKDAPRTTLMVTHDIQEALLLSHRIIVLGGEPGTILFDKELSSMVGHRDLGTSEYGSLFQQIYQVLVEG